MNPEQEIISLLQAAPAEADQEQLWRLGNLLNDLILHDFNALVQLLYRMDVPEREVRALLQQNAHTNAGQLLARLLLQRQKEKALLREKLRSNPDNIPDEDRW